MRFVLVITNMLIVGCVRAQLPTVFFLHNSSVCTQVLLQLYLSYYVQSLQLISCCLDILHVFGNAMGGKCCLSQSPLMGQGIGQNVAGHLLANITLVGAETK